jgi:hypothetical protein
MFFSEEKNQKTLISSPAAKSWNRPEAMGQAQKRKVFWFFSSEKNILP